MDTVGGQVQRDGSFYSARYHMPSHSAGGAAALQDMNVH